VPTPTEADAKRQHRERAVLVAEQTAHTNRIKGIPMALAPDFKDFRYLAPSEPPNRRSQASSAFSLPMKSSFPTVPVRTKVITTSIGRTTSDAPLSTINCIV
jgi:hypothetical protein